MLCCVVVLAFVCCWLVYFRDWRHVHFLAILDVGIEVSSASLKAGRDQACSCLAVPDMFL